MSQIPLTNINIPFISDKKKIVDALFITGALLLIMWTVFLLEYNSLLHTRSYGLRPRTSEGLIGLFSIHFLHGDLKHIWQNSLAFVVLNSFLFYFYRTISLRVFAWLFITPGILLWLIGRPDNHIGASMLVYGQAAFLFVSGVIRANPQMLRVALFVALFYGSLVWYIFPINPHISWEGHLSGALAGVVLAIAYKEQGPIRKKFNWEIEEELEKLEEELADQEKPSPENNSTSTEDENRIKINYIYKSDSNA